MNSKKYENLSKDELIFLLMKSEKLNDKLIESHQKKDLNHEKYSKQLEVENQTLKNKLEEKNNKNKKLEEKNKKYNNANKELKNQYKIIYDEHQMTLVEYREFREKVQIILSELYDKKELITKQIFNIFCPSTEKTRKVNKAANEAEAVAEGQGISKKDKKSPGRKQGSSNYPDDIPVNETVEINPEETVCPNCGKELTYAGYDESTKIKMESLLSAIKYIVNKMVCTNCKKIYQGKIDNVFGHSPATPSFVADIVDMKYNLNIPIDRYSKYLKNNGYNISTQCLSNYVLTAAKHLKPLYEHLKFKLGHNASNVIYVDETPFKVIDECNKEKKRAKCYVFGYTTSTYEHPIVLYDYSIDRTTEQAEEILKDFDGYLICDKYSGYNAFKDKGVKIQLCWAHIRRYINDEYKLLSLEQQKTSVSGKFLKHINDLFAYEAKLREERLTPDEIKLRRNSDEYFQTKNSLRKLIDEYLVDVENGGLLAKALKYINNCWKDAFTFFENGHVDIHNNKAENMLRHVVIGRKNSLFAKTANGASSSMLLYSIVATAKSNGLKVKEYLEYLFESLNPLFNKNYECLSDSDMELLEENLPWSKKSIEKFSILT